MKSFDEAREALEGFTWEEAEIAVQIYVCARCEGPLTIISDLPGNERVSVVCLDCGNVEQIGRISKTTVAIRYERGIWEFPKAIRALPDLWGALIPTKEEIKKSISELGF